jgi:C4-dicarboxylate transporter DctM subunit
MFFAAISGSSPVTVITIGGIMYPALVKAGYDDKFSTGLVTSAGTLGILIPPSIPMIVYAIFASNAGQMIKVEEFFLAGLGPGAVIGGLLGGFCFIVGVRKGERFTKPDVGAFRDAVIEGFWSLMLPVVILGGIYSGLFNATEAAAVSVVYALAVELWIHRSLILK